MTRKYLCVLLALNLLLGPMAAALTPPYYKCYVTQTVQVKSLLDLKDKATGRKQCEVCVRIKLSAFRCNLYSAQDKFVAITDPMEISRVMGIGEVSEFLHVNADDCNTLRLKQKYASIGDFRVQDGSQNSIFDLGALIEKQKAIQQSNEQKTLDDKMKYAAELMAGQMSAMGGGG